MQTFNFSENTYVLDLLRAIQDCGEEAFDLANKAALSWAKKLTATNETAEYLGLTSYISYRDALHELLILNEGTPTGHIVTRLLNKILREEGRVFALAIKEADC